MAVRQITTKTGQKPWEVVARDGAGKMRRHRFPTKREANTYERQLGDEREAVRHGARFNYENPTLDVYVARYLSQHNVEPQTIRALGDRLAVAQRELGEVRLRDLDSGRIGRWLRDCQDHYAPTTHRALLKALRQVLAQAVRSGIIPANPASDVRLSPFTAPSKRPFRSWAEVEQVAEKAGESGGMIRFGAATGLRIQELLAVQWGDIEGRRLHVRRTIRNRRIVEASAKNVGSLRTVLLRQRALDALPWMPTAPNPDALIFGLDDREPFDLSNWRTRVWYPALKEAKLEVRGPKNLRHTFATLALTEKPALQIQDVARQLGHKDINVTLEHYTAYLVEHEEHVLDDLDAAEEASRRPPLPAVS